MNTLKNLLAKLPFFPYTKKVDFNLKTVLSIDKIKFIPLIIVFKKPVDSIIENRAKRLGLKITYTLPFLNALCGKFPAKNFELLLNILEVDKIYFDRKACLMSKAPNDSADASRNLLDQKTSYLSGKGVTVAFIDSGVFPHPDLIKPKNRVVAFRDFISGSIYPYDDNGHGTACIGAGFGASVDGRFKSLAYDANIVCAKAFDKFSMGFYSDILAAMQWIIDTKDKHNTRIVVLPFGSSSFTRRFDLLSHGVQKLWMQGLFVCTCTGNLGPSEGSITSPGISEYSFTTGACDTSTDMPKPTFFSGRGPIAMKLNKPDVVMPGFNVQSLNTETSYEPYTKGNYNIPSLSMHYRTVSGTSIAASFSAAMAALLLQKSSNLTPDDVKSILKTCSVSINELKTIQGAGIISIKKLEDH